MNNNEWVGGKQIYGVEETPQPVEIELTSAPHLGKNAYVRRIDGSYIKEKSTDSYTGFRKLTYELPDGIYEVSEAVFGERKTNDYALLVKDGIANKADTLAEILLNAYDILVDDFPIHGTPNQVKYARDLCKKDFANALKNNLNNPDQIEKIKSIAVKALDMEVNASTVIDRCKAGKLAVALNA